MALGASETILGLVTAMHYHRQRSPGEHSVDSAVAAAFHSCDAMEARLDELGAHIAAARHEAVAAGILGAMEPLGAQPPAERTRARRRVRVAARTALARATLR